MPTIALVGPDGAGKTTVARLLEHELEGRVRYLYMGVSAASSDRLLPTTRLAHAVKRALGAPPDTAGPRNPDRLEPAARGPLRRGAAALRGGVRLANRLAEEWARQARAWRETRRGATVIFDRHFFVDYYAYDVAPRAGRSLGRRLHGFVLAHLPKPDLVVYLDAPAEILLARKGEGTIDLLERRRQDYRSMAAVVPRFAVVDASRPLDVVVADVARVIRNQTLAGRAGDAGPGPRRGRGPAGRDPGAHAHAPHALVTDASRGSALAVIRSLGRKGWRVTAADEPGTSPGLRSRYAHDRFRYPSPRIDAGATAEAILGFAVQRGVDLVVPVTDEVILPLQAIRTRFEGVARLAIPESSAADLMRDKVATLRLAEQLGLEVPRWRLVSSLAEALPAGEELGWPLVLKPRASRVLADGHVRPLTVAFAGDAEALRARLAPLLPLGEVVVQEYVPGEGHGVELLMHDGRPLAGFQHRRLREVPVTGGASSYRESVALDPSLCAQAVRLLGAVQWTGLAMVEFRIGPQGARLMEVNGRIWGSLPLAVASGMDFPARLADLMMQGPPQPAADFETAYRVGVRCRNLGLDVAWILTVLAGQRRYASLPFPRRREALAAAVGLLDPSSRFDVLSLDDPVPGLVELLGIAEAVAGKLRA